MLVILKDGRIVNRDEFLSFIEDKSGRFIIKKFVETRSNQQNRYEHWVYNFISNEIGQDAETIKRQMKWEFLPKIETQLLDGSTKEEPVSVTTLNKLEHSDYMNKIRDFWLSFNGMVIPTPEDKYYLEHIDKYIEIKE